MMEDRDVYLRGARAEVRGRIEGKVECRSEDASIAIQTALDLVSAQGGGAVCIQPGVYNLRHTLRLPSLVTLQGSGRATLLRLAPDHDDGIMVVCDRGDGSEVKDLVLDGNRSNVPNSKAGLVLDHCGDCRVSGVTAARFGGYGIWVRNNSFLCTLDSCVAADNVASNIFFDHHLIGRGGEFVPNLVTGCTCYGGGTGVEVDNTIVLNIVGCQVHQPGGHAFHVRGVSNSVLISACRSFQCEQNAVLVEQSHEINISSNIFCWHRGHGIELVGVKWGSLTGNNVIDSGVREHEGRPMHGIWLREGCQGLQVTGNAVFNWGDQVPMDVGILEAEDCSHNVVVANNINYAVEEGVRASGAQSVVAHNVANLPEAYVGGGRRAAADFTVDRLSMFLADQRSR
jgi:hypothetical protein